MVVMVEFKEIQPEPIGLVNPEMVSMIIATPLFTHKLLLHFVDIPLQVFEQPPPTPVDMTEDSPTSGEAGHVPQQHRAVVESNVANNSVTVFIRSNHGRSCPDFTQCKTMI